MRQPPQAPSPDETYCLTATNLHHSYGVDQVLRGASLTVRPGERVAVVGSSGSGKSTLLLCLAGVIVPDGGEVQLAGHELRPLSESRRAALRLRNLGFVFQFSELVPDLSLLDNVALPPWLLGTARSAARARAIEVLGLVGLSGRVLERRPASVSGGEMQRAAIARAMVHQPAVVLADEPTGALDSATADSVLRQLLSHTSDLGFGLVVVTHDEKVASQMDRRVTLVDGRVVDG